MGDSLSVRLDRAVSAAREAGRVTLRYFQTPFDVEEKPDASPVTIADREAERVLFERLRSWYPEDGFLGEERGERPGTSGYRWIVDPIDGTKSFVHGVPLYGVMVALEAPDGEVALGVVNVPVLGDMVAAARGHGCYWNGGRARVSETSRVAEACVSFTCVDDVRESERSSALARVQRAARLTRGWGDCYGHILVATGRVDAMVDPVLADWDCAALLPIVEEAGGAFTDWVGRRTYRGRSGISTNGRLHEEIMAILHTGEGRRGEGLESCDDA